MAVHEAAHEAGDFGAGLQTLGHFRAAQIQVAVFQARFFAVDLIGVQRQRLGAVDDLQRVGEHFHFAGSHIFIDLAVRTRTHGADDLDAELIAQVVGLVERHFLVRIEEHLHDAFAVAHINKDQAAEIATTIDPTTQSDFLAHVGQIQLPAIFSTHTLSFYTADAAPGYCAPVARLLSDKFYLLPGLKSVAYQPVPLSWKPEDEINLVNAGCPHAGQSASGASENFCNFSNRWLQAPHAYS